MSRRYQNSQLAIGRMPTELVVEIFRIYHAACTSLDNLCTSSMDWLAVTRVCSLWRAIALTDTTLWMSFDMHAPPALIEEFCKRVGTRSLRITLPELCGKSTTFWDALLASVVAFATSGKVVGELDLHGDNYALRYALTKVYWEIKDELRVLRLTADDVHSTIPGFQIPFKFPRLEVLELTRAVVVLKSSLIRGCVNTLREVTLKHCILGPGVIQLASCTGLKKLTIEHVHIVSLGIPAMTLSALADLHLAGTARECASLRNLLEIPHRCRTLIEVQGMHDHMLLWLLKIASLHHTEHVQIRIGNTTIDVRCDVVPAAHHVVRFEDPGRLSNAVKALLSHVFALKPMKCSVHVDRGVSLTSAELARICGGELETASELTIDGPGAFLEALAENLGAPEEFLPGMRSLVVNGADFTRLSHEGVAAWREGVERRKVLARIYTVRCTGIQPNSQDKQ